MAKTGLAGVKESIDRAKSRQGGGGGNLRYFTWKDGDKHVLRFLTDDVITTHFYEWVLGKDGKATRDFISAPSYYEDDPNWKGEDWIQKYGGQSRDFKTKMLQEAKSRELTVGLAVKREEYSNDGKQGVRDVLDKIEVNGTSYASRFFGIVKQSHGNFWGDLLVFYNRYGTICDRDYEITREGDGKDTKYRFFALDPDPELPDAATAQAHYGYGKKHDADDPKRFLYVPQTLTEWAEFYASEDRAKYWLEGTPTRPTGSDGDESATETSVSTDADTTDEFEELRKQLLDNN